MEENKFNSPRKNQGWGKNNPFSDELGIQKNNDSDQVQDSYHDTGSGWIPFSARDKRPIKISLWDNSQVPGSAYPGRDRSQGGGSPWNGEGETVDRSNSKEYAKQENWEHLQTPDETPKFPTKIVHRNNPVMEMNEIIQGNKKIKIFKISSDDFSWMQETMRQMNQAIPNFTNELNRTLGTKSEGTWSFLPPAIRDGNTLRLGWVYSLYRGKNSKKFLLYIRYDAGADTYAASSSLYDFQTNEENTIQPWSDDVYVETLMDPQMWVRR